MDLSRRASGAPRQEATPAAWRSQSRGVPGSGLAHRKKTAAVLGFTLIELLVAISIMSLLALLSWRSLDGMTRTQTLTQQRADTLLRLQAGLGQWVADLDAVVETGEVQALSFDGQVLRLTRRDSAERGLYSPGVRVVAWTRQTGSTLADGGLATGQWARWESPALVRRDELARAWQRADEWGRRGGTGPAGSDTSIALFPIEQWQIFYHRGETWTNPQSAVGNESVAGEVTERSQLPNGVRLVLNLPAGQSVSGEVVRDWVRPALQGSGS